MKQLKLGIFALSLVAILSACSSNPSGGGKNADKNGFTLIDPTDTSMLTENCKAYVDAMREQEESIAEPYKYSDLKTTGSIIIGALDLGTYRVIETNTDIEGYNLLNTDAQKQVECCAKVTDERTFQDILQGIISGFSIGGSYLKTWVDENGVTDHGPTNFDAQQVVSEYISTVKARGR